MQSLIWAVESYEVDLGSGIYLTCLSLSFLICKMDAIVPRSKVVG